MCHTHTIHYQSYKISNIHVIKEAVGRFDRSKHGLEPSTDSQEAVGRFDSSKQVYNYPPFLCNKQRFLQVFGETVWIAAFLVNVGSSPDLDGQQRFHEQFT